MVQFISNQKWTLETGQHQWMGAVGVVTLHNRRSAIFFFLPVRRYYVFKNTIFYRCMFITCSRRKLRQSYTVVSTGHRGFNFFWLSGNFDSLHLVSVGPHYISCRVEFSALEAGASALSLALGVWSDDNAWFWNTCLVNIPFDICIMFTEFQHINKE